MHNYAVAFFLQYQHYIWVTSLLALESHSIHSNTFIVPEWLLHLILNKSIVSLAIQCGGEMDETHPENSFEHMCTSKLYSYMCVRFYKTELNNFAWFFSYYAGILLVAFVFLLQYSNYFASKIDGSLTI